MPYRLRLIDNLVALKWESYMTETDLRVSSQVIKDTSSLRGEPLNMVILVNESMQIPDGRVRAISSHINETLQPYLARMDVILPGDSLNAMLLRTVIRAMVTVSSWLRHHSSVFPSIPSYCSHIIQHGVKSIPTIQDMLGKLTQSSDGVPSQAAYLA